MNIVKVLLTLLLIALFFTGCKKTGEDYYKLGLKYDGGKEGNQKDFKKARELYKKSCELYSGAGCASLAILYLKAAGGPQNIEKGKEYLKEACDLKYGKGCFVLAITYENDPDEASKFYKKGCDLGESISCKALALLKEKEKKHSKE